MKTKLKLSHVNQDKNKQQIANAKMQSSQSKRNTHNAILMNKIKLNTYGILGCDFDATINNKQQFVYIMFSLIYQKKNP